MRKSLVIVTCVVILFVSLTTPIAAQTGVSAWLSPPDLSNFPQIRAYLNVYDQQGDFVSGLSSGQVTLQEDDNSLHPDQITEETVGAQVVFGINFGTSFAIRDSQGISRWDTLYAALEGWGSDYPDDLSDDLSLLTNDAGEYRHLGNIAGWLNALRGIEIDPRESQENIDVLANALDTASDNATQAGRGNIVIFITPPPNQSGIAAIQNLTTLAVQQNVRVVIWMVASEDLFTSQGADQLRDLAFQTGGSFFAFSGTETIPNLHDSIDPLRKTYEIIYKSQLQRGVDHSLVAIVDTAAITATSQSQAFTLEVLPPNPILVSPPQQINLQVEVIPNSEPEEENALSYTPQEQDFEILVEFPDGLPRDITRSTLYVDDQPVDENLQQPFNNFTWDLTAMQFESEHQLQVEVTDILGISNRSILTPVQITIDRTPRSALAVAYQYRWWVIGSTAILAAGIILVVLITGGKISPRAMPRRRSTRANNVGTTTKPKRKDPVTQPVKIEQPTQASRLPQWVRRLSWPQRQPDKPAPAYIEPFQNGQNHANLVPIDLAVTEMIIGSDPAQSSVIIDSPGVEPVHARIISEPEENYRIFDLSSVAGTLVNFALLSPGGARLRHGDIIHIGAISYRMMFRDPSRIPKPVVQPLER